MEVRQWKWSLEFLGCVLYNIVYIMQEFKDELAQSLETSFIDYTSASEEKYRTKLLLNDPENGSKVLSYLLRELDNCDAFDFSVAFITEESLVLLHDVFEHLRKRGVRGRILTSSYLCFNSPKMFRRLLEIKNVETRIVDDENFHAKGYIFRQGEHYNMIVGSSNMTIQALTKNREWNIKLTSSENGDFSRDVLAEFDELWKRAAMLSCEWIDEYEKNYHEPKALSSEEMIDLIGPLSAPEPNKMQCDALKGLKDLRDAGKNKALLISATGTGKTYLSAFDVKDVNPQRMLFIVHREQIAKKTMQSFKTIFADSRSMGLLSGSAHELDADFVFATMQSLALDHNLQCFNPDTFDYIIIDEAHRTGAYSYNKILNYFRPKFLLGMTATPDRMDNYDVYRLFEYNIAYEIRLQEALEENMLCPFHYFGITDITIDGEALGELSSFELLTSEQRVKHIIDKINDYGYSGDRVKGLVFCSRNDEAKELSRKFNERGFKTLALSGANTQEEREEAIRRLSTNYLEEALDYIFTVDIFNEGIDIPDVNQVVMLRPTQSAVIFVQQLGRGLRKAPGKSYVVVIDFIGNYTNNFLIPIALSGDRTMNKDTLKKYVLEGMNMIPGVSTIMFDEVSQARIYNSINSTRFSCMKIVKEEYGKLKKRLGRVPKIMDFYRFGGIDPQLFFNVAENYNRFLAKVEQDDKYLLIGNQDRILSFVSKEVSYAKRPHEAVILRELLRSDQVTFDEIVSVLKDEFGITDDVAGINSAINFLGGKFLVQLGLKRYQEGCRLVEVSDLSVRRSESFRDALNDDFVGVLEDLLQYTLQLCKDKYSERYRGTNLTLNEKYSRRDVCRLLNWPHDDSSTLYGYQVKHKTCPIFVTYKKSQDIVDSIKYEDCFINSGIFSWMTRNGVRSNSNEAVAIRNAVRDGLKIYLFVKKEDAEGKDFYFLGEIVPIKDIETTIVGKNDRKLPIVNFEFKMLDEVREDIYDFLLK